MKTMTKESVHKNLHHRLQQVMAMMLQKDDSKHAQQMNEIIEKLDYSQLHIAICGHYSAGKSSLINALSGKDYLPSGPIPASANVVTIRGGAPGSFVTHVNEEGKPSKKVSVPTDELHDYCLNGTDIASVELSVPSPILVDHGLALLDTPGIDSTDERHQAATNAALHLADVVFYVVDYNHVESENNLSFSRKMKELGKPLYLLVNQIDKHRDRELSIDAFRSRVAESFHQWDADPEHIFLLSVKHQDHRYSEWEQFIWLLKALGERKDDLTERGAVYAAKQVIADHVQLIMERKHQAEREQLLARVEQYSLEDVQAKRDQYEQQIEAIESAPSALERALQQEIQKLLDDAQIMPAVTRDKAGDYLESQQERFKVGLFSGRKKIDQEKRNREEAFLKELQENVDTQIAWHLQQLFQKHLPDQSVDSFQIVLSASDLKEQMKPGAVYSGQYTIQYCHDLAAAIRSRFRRAAWQRLESIVQQMERQSADKVAALKAEEAKLTPIIQVYERLDELDEESKRAEQALVQLLPETDADAAGPDLPRMEDAPKRKDMDKLEEHSVRSKVEQRIAKLTPLEQTADRKNVKSHRQKLEGAAERLAKVAQELESLPAMRETAQYLRAKAERLKQNRFTIALFGAFSAGKSSFVNTLLGSDVVPVSPHPTTAVVNRVVPATKEFPSGTAVIQMKTAERLKEEFAYAFELLGLTFEELDAAIEQIRKLQPAAFDGSAKVQVTFLKAAAAGWQEMKPLLGETLQVGQEEFRKFAADEKRSCFVEAIDLYHQSALTEQGIVLVDTPGADSVNARHTGVAFNYIKNADAIIYVTYYNHAFSRADREFLLQLGRVKDNFELDKMFFLVNAADLASSKEELDTVVQHVTDNLAACNIRNPKIFPISSLDALEAKWSGDAELLERSGLPQFEKHFYAFVWDELADVLVGSANQEIRECVQALDRWRLSLAGEQSERERKKAQLLEYRRDLPKDWPRDMNDISVKVEGEAKEWMYYVKQRVLYRFGETFSAAFHPSSLSSQDGDIRAKLRLAWMELISILSVQCSQEVLAITLKIENLLQEWLKEQQSALVTQIRKFVPSYPGFELEPYSFETAPVDEQLEVPEKPVKWLMKQFKNAKTFFEQGGKDELRSSLESELMAYVSDYVDHHTERLIGHYGKQLAMIERELHERRVQSFEAHIDAVVHSLSDERLAQQIEQKKNVIEQTLQMNA